MSTIRFVSWFSIVAALTALSPGLGGRAILAAPEAPPIPLDDIQVLAAGPIHEAFAEAVVLDPEPGIMAPKAPPPLIEEIPPDQRPEGDVQWIPGYWAWDDDRNDYIWISGIWRVPPPGRQWIPGYWSRTTQGYQWISGYWTGAKVVSTEYLPEPPESVEVGPSSNAPSPDYIWIPGCWLWQQDRYFWRPGYWTAAHPDWVWVPGRYNWTPRGYVFVSGYWDFTVIHRGVLFAPVFFPKRAHLGMTFSFTPGFMISLSVFNDALFLRPRYGHYYFGDYYAPDYYRKGIYPWFSLHARRVVYDPIYAHQRWSHRNDHDWEKGLETKFHERRQYAGPRPPRSFDHRTGSDNIRKAPGTVWIDTVKPLDSRAKTKANAFLFKPLSEKERREFTQRGKAVRSYQQERQRRETQMQQHPQPGGSKIPQASREKVSTSPIMDKGRQKAAQKNPPAVFQAPKPNPNVEPLQRKNIPTRSQDKFQRQENGRGQPEAVGRQPVNRPQKSGGGGWLNDRLK